MAEVKKTQVLAEKSIPNFYRYSYDMGENATYILRGGNPYVFDGGNNVCLKDSFITRTLIKMSPIFL